MKLNDQNEFNAKYLALLPQWKCHKVVRAGKISLMAADEPNGLLMIHAEPSNMPFAVPLDFLQRHAPERGGYFVVYEDGYLSYSPAEVFEAGYHAHWLPECSEVGKQLDEAPAFIDKKAQVPLTAEIEPLLTVAAPANTGFQWRKRPVVIEAFQLKENHPTEDAPGWAEEAKDAGVISVVGVGKVAVTTLEGVMTADVGDWIIRGVKGELYPCKPDIFAATYEPAYYPTGEIAVLGEEVNGEAPITFFPAPGDIDLNAADFSDALMWLKEGKRVQRAGWNGKGQWVEMATGDGLSFSSPHLDVSMPVALHLVLKNAQDVFVPGWTPSTGDLMADDWQVVS